MTSKRYSVTIMENGLTKAIGRVSLNEGFWEVLVFESGVWDLLRRFERMTECKVSGVKTAVRNAIPVMMVRNQYVHLQSPVPMTSQPPNRGPKHGSQLRWMT